MIEFDTLFFWVKIGRADEGVCDEGNKRARTFFSGFFLGCHKQQNPGKRLREERLPGEKEVILPRYMNLYLNFSHVTILG